MEEREGGEEAVDYFYSGGACEARSERSESEREDRVRRRFLVAPRRSSLLTLGYRTLLNGVTQTHPVLGHNQTNKLRPLCVWAVVHVC